MAVTDTGEYSHTILIVDDAPENLMLLGELLQSDYRVRAVNSGLRALQVVNSDPQPDLILLDVMMPGMDGYEVLRQLREQTGTREIPVIFITAMNEVEDEEKGLRMGAVDYITKPFSPAIVQARVRTQLELKASRDRLSGQNQWLECEVNRRMQESQLVRDLSVRALACLAEVRDQETGLHIARTQTYVEILARQLISHPRFSAALEGGKLEEIVRAAPLHDIGKIGIPDSILLKPGKLTAEEFAVMKSHSEVGAQAIENAIQQAVLAAGDGRVLQMQDAAHFLHVASVIARYHHEKWDGSGYPTGLSGEDIPVPARLMALADVFDALTSQRTYKEAMGIDTAVEIILAGKGTHFDPDVVDGFMACREKFIDVSNSFRKS